MKKLLAFGLLFCSGILFSPTTAIQGLDKNSNCRFQLPYTIEELTGMRQQISVEQQESYRINTVNSCTNRNEKLQLATISEDATTLHLKGFWADAKGNPVWRQITIDKTTLHNDRIHQAALMKLSGSNQSVVQAKPFFTAHIVDVIKAISF